LSYIVHFILLSVVERVVEACVIHTARMKDNRCWLWRVWWSQDEQRGPLSLLLACVGDLVLLKGNKMKL